VDIETHGSSSSKRRAFPALVTLVAVVLSLAGCRGVLGVDGYGTIPLDHDAAPASCQSCMADHCSVEEVACATEPACAALEACLGKCRPDESGTECRVTCNLSIRRTSEMSSVIACAAQRCDQCAAAHVTFGGLQCTNCLEQKAHDSLAALSASIPALELEACQQDCSPGFEDECPCTDLAAAPLDGGLGGAAMLKSLRHVPMCSVQCSKDADADWSCLGHVQSPPLARSDAPKLSLHVRLAGYLETINGEQPRSLPNVEVTACTGNAECTDPSPDRSTRTREGTGVADLLLGPTGGAYFSDLAVRWSEGEPSQMSTVLLYFFPPLRRSPSWTWRRLVSRQVATGLIGSFDPSLVLDWEKNGGIVWSVAACNGVPAANVTARLVNGSEKIVYVKDNFTLTEDPPRTSSVGLGAVISVTPGTRKMILYAPDDRIIGEYEFFVAPGAITTLSFAPVPVVGLVDSP
jgi:hypothetical protein